MSRGEQDVRSWHDRRMPGERHIRHERRHAMELLMATAALVAFWYVGSSRILRAFIDPFDNRRTSGDDRVNRGESDDDEDLAWLRQTQRRVTMTAHGHRCLQAVVLDADCAQPPAHRYMICCNSRTGVLADMAYSAHRFARMGFTVVIPTGHVVVQGKRRPLGMGLLEGEDLLAWIHEVLVQDRRARIVLRGVSMGAAAVMMASGSAYLPAAVIGAIEECGYADAYHQLLFTLRGYGHLPRPVASMLAVGANILCRRHAGYDLRDANCVHAMRRTGIPMLFVQAGNDRVVDPKDCDRLMHACASRVRERLVVPGVGHAQCAGNNTVYWTRASLFIDALDW